VQRSPSRPPVGAGPYYRRCDRCAVHDAVGDKDVRTVHPFPTWAVNTAFVGARVSESLRGGVGLPGLKELCLLRRKKMLGSEAVVSGA
jgi:hypothetical protein